MSQKANNDRLKMNHVIQATVPRECKKILIGMAYLRGKSHSELSSYAIQKYTDSLPPDVQEKCINVYNSLTPEQRRKTKNNQ